MQSCFGAINIYRDCDFMTKNGIERNLRDSVGCVLYSGTFDIQRNIIAQYLGL